MRGIMNKGEYQGIETQRFLRKHDITTFTHNPFFPVNTLQLMRGAVFARTTDYFQVYVNEIYRHMWYEPKKMDDMDVFESALHESGLPASDIMTGIQDQNIKQQLITNTERSVEMGTFGSPTFYVENEIFFGKDKLRDAEEEILARRA